jgi:sigma-E factor negative regulatory protein RseC
MSKADNVYHSGIVESIQYTQAEVRIVQQSACGSCHAKSMCALSDLKEKIVHVDIPSHRKVQVGETVTIVMQESKGMLAVLLAYFLPFLLLMITLVTTWSMTANEGLSGLLAVGILIPYFLILYALRDRIKKEFVFKIE